MSLQAKPRMNVDEFLAWAETQPGRYELVDGEVFAMSPQRVRHARVKYSVQSALGAAIGERNLPCEMLPDGVTVRVDAWTSFEPDAMVHCGEALDPEAIVAPEPIVVVEVVSPGTKHVDTNRKLEGYFRVPSVMHYLIVEPKRPMVIHHRRIQGDVIETAIVSTGTLTLDPPGLTLSIVDLFGRIGS